MARGTERTHGGLRGFLAVAVALSLASLVPPISEESSAIPGLSVTVSLYPESMEAKVTQSQFGSCTFGGNVTVEKPQGFGRVTVSLTCQCSEDWEVALSKQTVVFVNPRTESFQVTVAVPAGERVGTADVTVHAHAECYVWQQDSSDTAQVMVAQYFKFKLEVAGDMPEVEPGGTTVTHFNVTNLGNGVDTFELEIANNRDLSRLGYTVLLGSTDVRLDPEGTARVKLTVQTPQGESAREEIVTISVKATSAEARAKNLLISKETPLFIHVKNATDPGGGGNVSGGTAQNNSTSSSWFSRLPLAAIGALVVVVLVAAASLYYVRSRRERGARIGA